MKVTREKPSQRRHHRVNAALRINVNGETYTAMDWGLGGFALDGWKDASLQAGDNFSCNFCLPFQGFDIRFDLDAEVVRISDDERLAAKFVSLDNRQKELMTYFIDELVRGSMMSIDDTLLRIDSPVTPVSTKPDPSPASEIPKSRWSLKLITMTAIYLSGGMSLLVYIVFTLYANYFSLEVDSGVVTAPIEKIVSTTDGQIRKVSIGIDEFVTKGYKLITIEDSKVERDIELAKVNIERTRSEVELKQQELSIERDKLDDYRYVTINMIDELNASIDSLTKQKFYAKKDVARFNKLIRDDYVPHQQLDGAKSLLAKIEGELARKKLELKKYQTLLKKINAGRYFTGERFEGRSKELEAEVNQLKEEVALTTRELVALYEHKERLTIQAPSNGRLVDMLKTVGSSTKRGEAIALFEREENRVIEVFLTQDEVIDIRMGNKARAYFPSKDIIVNTFIKKIDRTEGYIDEIESRYNWRGVEDRTAKVTLEILGYNDAEIREQFTPGLPVVVIFPNIQTGVVGNFINSIRSQTGSVKKIETPEEKIGGIYL